MHPRCVVDMQLTTLASKLSEESKYRVHVHATM